MDLRELVINQSINQINLRPHPLRVSPSARISAHRLRRTHEHLIPPRLLAIQRRRDQHLHSESDRLYK